MVLKVHRNHKAYLGRAEEEEKRSILLLQLDRDSRRQLAGFVLFVNYFCVKRVDVIKMWAFGSNVDKPWPQGFDFWVLEQVWEVSQVWPVYLSYCHSPPPPTYCIVLLDDAE